jgi:type IV pilus assembly protein PilA
MLSTSSREEQGFTLIELLVVMIIISILMAVAVPTFLSQKNTALKTQATSNIKNVINAVESCASQITTGGYKDPTTDCTDGPTLVSYEASLKNLGITRTALTAAIADIPKTYVDLVGTTGQGYIVEKVIQDSGQFVFFAEIHTEAGDLYKWCNTAPVPLTQATAPTSATQANTKTCKKGTW